jgi:predicted RNA binding protein YcfA (HicA-like mRNA interferase family)
VKVKELTKLIEKGGWEQTRMKGSQRQNRHPEKEGTVTVAGKQSADIYHQVHYNYSLCRLPSSLRSSGDGRVQSLEFK